jgi:hypothetical protein
MNFLAPIALWFAATIPVVVVFYLLKRRRVVRVVPSTLLWQRFLAETQASAPFQKLRHNWLLLLQILLLLLAVLALARPYFSGKSGGGRTLVVILDASASMQAVDETPSRFEKARSEALRLVDSMRGGDLMVVLQAGANTEVKQSATSEKAALRRALQSTGAMDAPTRLKEALKLAGTLIRNNAKAEIHLFSDGAVGALDEFENSGLPLVFHRLGVRANNLAITTLDVRPNPENAAERAVFTSVVNYSTNTHQTELEFRLDERLLETKSLTLAPGETSPQVFLATQTTNGIFNVRLSARDDLAADNQASIVSLIPQPSRVLLMSSGNRFIEKALRAAENVELSVTSGPALPQGDFDVVVLDNVTPATWPAANTLSFNLTNPAWFADSGRQDAPAIVDWKGAHPLLRFVSFDNVQIGQSLLVKTPPWAVALVESPQTPLLLAGELGRQRVVWIGFDTLQSTWPLRVSFPIFIANAMEWLSPASLNASQLTVQAGTPFRFALTGKADSAEITTPDGVRHPWPVDAARNEIVFGETFRQGVHHLKAGTNAPVAFCVNLLDAAESNLEPKDELRLGKYTMTATTTLRQANMEIWRWIALAGLAVLLAEWWYYHRRTA